MGSHRQRRPAYPDRPDDRRAQFDDMQARLTKRYGAELGPWLARRVAKLFRDARDTYCVDNFRVCDMSRPDEVEKYRVQRASGCCGSADRSITHYSSGRVFRYGFNYGH